MKELFIMINKMYYKSFTNICWRQEFYTKKETAGYIYEYFNKTKEDMIEDMKYEYELSEEIPFEKILEYNPYKFKKNMRPDEIRLARWGASDKTLIALMHKYLNRTALDDNFEYDQEKISQAIADYQPKLNTYIKDCLNSEFINNKEKFQWNDQLKYVFKKSDLVAVDDIDKAIYPIFKVVHYSSYIEDSRFKSDSYLYDEKNFVDNVKAIEYVKREEKRIRLENNGPDEVNNESFASWIGRGFNDEVLNEYIELFVNVNVGGLFYLKENIEANRDNRLCEKYIDYKIVPLVVIYNPINGDRLVRRNLDEVIYMNTDFSQVEDLKGKYQ